MCEPTTISLVVGAAMSAASMYMQKKAQDEVVNKRNEVAHAEAARETEYQHQADAVNQKTEPQFTREAQDAGINQEADKREKYIADNMPQMNLSGVPQSEGAPSTVKNDLASRLRDALSYGRNMATSQARLGAYGSNQFNNSVTLAHTNQDLGRITGYSDRSSNIAGLELGGANQAGGDQRQLADLFRLGGQAGLVYGMTGSGVRPQQAPAPVTERGSTFSGFQ